MGIINVFVVGLLALALAHTETRAIGMYYYGTPEPS